MEYNPTRKVKREAITAAKKKEAIDVGSDSRGSRSYFSGEEDGSRSYVSGEDDASRNCMLG
jgi:hypothetical protein